MTLQFYKELKENDLAILQKNYRKMTLQFYKRIIGK